MISIVCFSICSVLVLDLLLRKTDPFSPFRLYLFFHSLTFGVANLNFDKAMTPFSFETNVVFYGSGICFLMGTQLIALVMKFFPVSAVTMTTDMQEHYNWKLHFIFSLPLFLLYVFGIVWAVKGYGTLPLFSGNIVKAIYDFMGYSTLSAHCIALAGVAMIMLFISGSLKKIRMFGLNISMILCILLILVHLTTLSRSSFMFFLFFSIVYYNYAVKKINVGRLIILFLLIFTTFTTVAYMKMSNIQKKEQLAEGVVQDIVVTALKFPYKYIANNFWNLDYGITVENYEVRHKTTYGFTTFSGIFDMIYTGYIWGPKFRESMNYEDIFHKKTQKVSGLNTISYQWGLYKDFGLLGTFIFPFLFGMAISVLYWKVKCQPSIFNVSVYSYIAYFIGMSWFLAFWEINMYIYPLAYMVICGVICHYSAGEKKENYA